MIREVEVLFADIGNVAIAFESIGRFQQTLYFKPEPIAPLVRMIEVLVERWPQWPPYGGIHEGIVPHLTIADRRDDALELDRIAVTVESKLPFATTLMEAWIIEAEADGLWYRRAIIPLSNVA